MKRLFLLLLILPMLFVACSDDDDDADYSNTIVATWKPQAITDLKIEGTPGEIAKSMEENILKSLKEITPEEMGLSGTTTINTDNTFTETIVVNGETTTLSGTYSINGKTLTLNYGASGGTKSGTVEIKGNTMYMTANITNEIKQQPEYKEMIQLLKESGVSFNLNKMTATAKYIKQ